MESLIMSNEPAATEGKARRRSKGRQEAGQPLDDFQYPNSCPDESDKCFHFLLFFFLIFSSTLRVSKLACHRWWHSMPVNLSLTDYGSRW